MAKIHLLMKKEDIDIEKMREGNKVAIVLDVLLATTTIISALNDGADAVIPVIGSEEAIEKAKNYRKEEVVIAGELNTKPIEGFVYPSPRLIRKNVKGKTLILSTTNGTVALSKSSAAKQVYISSLLNNPSVAEHVISELTEETTIVVVCSGNSGEISLEDLYGAGHFISCLVGKHTDELKMTDAAKAALYFYRGSEEDAYHILLSSFVGQIFNKYGFLDELQYASTKGSISIVPVLKDGKVIAMKFLK